MILAELVWQTLGQDSSSHIICIAESNNAVDVICRRLRDMGLDPVRDTPHYEASPDLWALTPDRLLGSEGTSSARRRVVQNASIVCMTLLRAASSRMRNLRFDLVIIDEASQISEAMSWVSLHLGMIPSPWRIVCFRLVYVELKINWLSVAI